MVTGMDLIQRISGKSSACLTMPLLVSSSGVKMGKSSGNGIWLDPRQTSVYDFYQVSALVEVLMKHALSLLPFI